MIETGTTCKTTTYGWTVRIISCDQEETPTTYNCEILDTNGQDQARVGETGYWFGCDLFPARHA